MDMADALRCCFLYKRAGARRHICTPADMCARAARGSRAWAVHRTDIQKKLSRIITNPHRIHEGAGAHKHGSLDRAGAHLSQYATFAEIETQNSHAHA